MKREYAKIIINIALIALSMCIIYYISTIGFYIVTHPSVELGQLDTPIDVNVTTAKQINEFVLSVISSNEKLDKYDLTTGYIDMKLDSSHRGKIEMRYVEKSKKNSHVFIVSLDTKEGLIYKIEDYSRESKLYPGEINLSNWVIDSSDAIKITESFYKDVENFRYGEAWLTTTFISDTEEELWNVTLVDKHKNTRYDARIDPYTGEIVSHSTNN